MAYKLSPEIIAATGGATPEDWDNNFQESYNREEEALQNAAAAVANTVEVADETAMLSLTILPGRKVKRADNKGIYELQALPNNIGNWKLLGFYDPAVLIDDAAVSGGSKTRSIDAISALITLAVSEMIDATLNGDEEYANTIASQIGSINGSLAALGATKLNISDIVENLSTVGVTGKALGAGQGSVIAGLIDTAMAQIATKENSANKATDFSTVNHTKFPTVQAAKAYIDGLVVGLLDDRGNHDASGNVFPSSGGSGTSGAVMKGDFWYISVAGTLGGVAVGIGDSIRAKVDGPAQTASNWAILEGNIGYVPENVSNKDTDVNLSANSDINYASQKAVKAYADTKIAISAIVNILTSTSTTAPLSAAQGKVLKDLVDTKLGINNPAVGIATLTNNAFSATDDISAYPLGASLFLSTNHPTGAAAYFNGWQYSIVFTLKMNSLNATQLVFKMSAVGSATRFYSSGWSAFVGEISTYDLANNLTTTTSGAALDARQGKTLKDNADALSTTVAAKEVLANKATDFTTVNHTKYPTVQAAKSYIDGLVVGLLDDRGNHDASGNVFPSTGGSGTAGAVMKGDLWYISVAGTLGGVAVEIGDSIRAKVDAPGQTAGNWAILEGNIGYVPENLANKDTDTALTANSDTKYASQKAVKAYADTKIAIAAIVNVLTSTSTTAPLSAAQGKVLKDLINDLGTNFSSLDAAMSPFLSSLDINDTTTTDLHAIPLVAFNVYGNFFLDQDVGAMTNKPASVAVSAGPGILKYERFGVASEYYKYTLTVLSTMETYITVFDDGGSSWTPWTKLSN